MAEDLRLSFNDPMGLQVAGETIDDYVPKEFPMLLCRSRSEPTDDDVKRVFKRYCLKNTKGRIQMVLGMWRWDPKMAFALRIFMDRVAGIKVRQNALKERRQYYQNNRVNILARRKVNAFFARVCVKAASLPLAIEDGLV